MIDQQTTVLLFFVAAIFLVASSPCFAISFTGQGELGRGRRVKQNYVKQKMSISKMNVKKTRQDQYPCCGSKEFADSSELGGEISGSVSITEEGQVWLTVFLDDIAILASVYVIERDNEELAYRLIIEKLDRAAGTQGSVSADALSLLDKEARMTEFSTREEAVLELLRLMDALGLDVQPRTRKAIPIVIECGWRSPETSKKMIAEAVAAGNERNEK